MASYVLHVWGGVDPAIDGPHATGDERDLVARRLYAENGSSSEYYALDVAGDGTATVSAYGADFFEESDASTVLDAISGALRTYNAAEGSISAYDALDHIARILEPHGSVPSRTDTSKASAS